MRNVFLLLSTDNIGGAEKRFFGLWKAIMEMEQKVSCKLVITPKLYKALQEQENSSQVLHQFYQNIIQYEFAGGFKFFKKAVKSFVAQHSSEGDVLHYIGDHPLCVTHKRRQVFSITQSSLKNLNAAGKIGQVAGIYYSDMVDILDPVVYEQMSKLFFYKRKRIFRTSNSFCDTELFYSLPYTEKKDWFVFLGRFEVMKQPLALLSALPSLYAAIKDQATDDLHFYFFGHGSKEAEMRQVLERDEFKNIPVTITYNSKPNGVLAESKFFFSLQLHNNYPSKSLIEAMSAGNVPIVTDVGQTRWLAKPGFSYFVPERFNEKDIVNTAIKIYAEDKSELALKSAMARAFVMKEHTIEKMRDYYLSLYSRL
jgi:glycosyltransferase involved in cell wall biosynthesis